MKFLAVVDWFSRFGFVFGTLCLVYAAYCITDNCLRNRRAEALYKVQLANENKRLRARVQQDHGLIEWARSRELELTEERNILRKRNVFMAKELRLEDMQSKRTCVWKRDESEE